MSTDFRYWISKNHVDAVSILFDENEKAHMFSLNLDITMNQKRKQTDTQQLMNTNSILPNL